MKKLLAPALLLALSLSACASRPAAAADSAASSTGAEPVEIVVFAAASLTEAMDQIIADYESAVPGVAVLPTYDSSGTLKTQIQEGADCDLFLSAAPKQMNALDGSFKAGGEKNPDGLDLIDGASRMDLLENKVVLAAPEGNPKGVAGFDQLAELLTTGDVFLAMGNSDVPVGQYTQKIFASYGLDEAALARSGVLTYGSNVKEVTTQISEGVVDCGVIYATDAAAAGLAAVDEATAQMCGQVLYPAAVLKNSAHPDEARAFLNYLAAEDAAAVFRAAGFTPLATAVG